MSLAALGHGRQVLILGYFMVAFFNHLLSLLDSYTKMPSVMLRISFSFDTPNPDCGITYFLTKPLFSQELQNDLEQALVRIDIRPVDRAHGESSPRTSHDSRNSCSPDCF